MAEFTPNSGTFVLRSPVTGELQAVPADQADDVAAKQGLVYASPEEIDKHNLQERRGGAGQVALGLAETATRNATLGAVPSLTGDEDAARERAQYTGREYPTSSAVAGAAPSLVASAATGGLGAGLMGTAALEGAAGAYGNVGALADEAFKRDQELSAEQVIGAAGTGFFLGAASAGVGAAIGKGVGAVRNRLVEASAKATRTAETKAAEAVGLVNADRAVFRAADSPVEAATLRKAADEARPGFAAETQKAVSDLDTAAANTRQSTAASALDEAFPGEPSPTGDVTRQAPPLRAIVDDLEKSLPPESPVRAATQLWKEDISKAASSQGFKDAATSIEREVGALADQSRDPELAKALQKTRGDLRDYGSNASLFGDETAKASATRAELQESMEQSRANLAGLLEKHDYSQVAGTRAGRDIEDAAGAYADAIKKVDPKAAETVDAAMSKFGVKGPVAAGNQVDALLAAPQSARTGSRTAAAEPDMFRDIMGEAAETAVESIIPGAGMLRKAWKYKGHIFNLSADARDKAVSAADRFLSGAAPVAQTSRRGATLAASRATVTTPEEDAAQYKKIRGAVELLSKEPERLADALATSMGDIPNAAPELHMAVAAKAQAAVEFLQSKLPPAFAYSLANPEGPPPSRTDVLELMSYVKGVTDVPGVLQGIGDGSAMPEEIEAFKAVYPAWYGELQEDLTIKLQDRARKGYVIPGMRIAQLDSLLDLGGTLDATFSDEVAAISHQSAQVDQQQQQAAAPRSVTPKAGSRIQNSTLQKVQGNAL